IPGVGIRSHPVWRALLSYPERQVDNLTGGPNLIRPHRNVVFVLRQAAAVVYQVSNRQLLATWQLREPSRNGRVQRDKTVRSKAYKHSGNERLGAAPDLE